MGGEVKMVPELPKALIGGIVDDYIYFGDLEPDRISGFASENLPQLAAAHALAKAVNTGDTKGTSFWINWWLRRMKWERTNFMGCEMCGRTYPGWHFMAKRVVLALSIRFKWFELEMELRSWMKCYLALVTLAIGKHYGREITNHRIAEAGVITGDGSFVEWSGRFCAWSGDRSDARMNSHDAKENGMEDGSWWGWLAISSPSIWLSLSLGEHVSECAEKNIEKACGGVLWMDESDRIDFISALSGDFSKVKKYLIGWESQVPIRIVQTTEGVWTLSPIGRGSSTPHSYAVAQWHDSGIVRGLYADPGWRDASGDHDWIVSGNARVEGNTAICERSDGKYGSPHRMQLPGGEILFDITFPLKDSQPSSGEPGVTPPSTNTQPPINNEEAAPEIINIERPGKYVIVWRGRARVLSWKSDDGRTLVVCDKDGDPE